MADWGGWAVTLGDQYSDGSGASIIGSFAIMPGEFFRHRFDWNGSPCRTMMKHGETCRNSRNFWTLGVEDGSRMDMKSELDLPTFFSGI